MGKIILNGIEYTKGGGGASSLVGLTDVDISSPSDGQVLVYDANSSKWKNGGVLHKYSTTEHIVGEWIDGKPIYERTFELTSPLSVPYNTWTDTPILNAGMQRIINGFANDSYVNGGVSQSNTFLYLSFAVNAPTYVRVLNARNASITLNIITLQYTKTTD